MTPTMVVNVRHESFQVYIGRAGHGEVGTFGNPHTIGQCSCGVIHDRDGAIESFRAYFHARLAVDKDFAAAVAGLKGKRLGCFCAPLRCHGDVIAAWVDWVDAEPMAR